MKRLSLLVTVLTLISNVLLAGCVSTVSNANNDSNIINDTETDTVDNYERNDELLDTSEGVEVFDLYGMDLEVKDAKAADHLLNEFASYFRIDHCVNDLSLSNETDVLNEKHYRFQQFYEGLPLYGKEVIVSTQDNKAVSVIVNTDNIERASTEIETGAVKIICETLDMDYDTLIKLRQVYLCETDDEYKVVFVINTEDGDFILADATTGEIIKRKKMIDTEQVEGVELQGQEFKRRVDIVKEDNTYSLIDEKRNIYVYDLGQNDEYLNYDDKFSKGKLISFEHDKSNINGSAVDALYNIERVYDFYDLELGHKSSDGKGKATIRIFDGFDEHINFEGKEDDYSGNAGAWGRPKNGTTEILIGPRNGKTYADNLDVMAHEFTHSVIHYTILDEFSNPEGEALNEGIADIIGLMIEAYYNENKECDWNIGKRDYTKGDLKKSYLEYSDSLDCHYGGAIICNVARLMWDGDPKTDAIEPIKDPVLMAELWYRVIMMINVDLDYSQCRTLVELNALNMQRDGKLTKEQYQCVLWSCDQAQIKYRLKSGWASDKGLLHNDVFWENSNAYPSNTDIIATVYDYEKKVTEEFDARIFNSDKQIVQETKNEPLVINLPKGVYTIEIAEKDSDVVTYRGLLRICEFGLTERKEFLDRKLYYIDLYTKLGLLSYEIDDSSDSSNKKEENVDNNKTIEMTYEEGYEDKESNGVVLGQILSDVVTIKGKLVKASNYEPPNPPYKDCTIDNISLGTSFISDYVEYESDLKYSFNGQYIVNTTNGIQFDSPITLSYDGKEVTISEIGIVYTQNLEENKTYIFKGLIYDDYYPNYESLFDGTIADYDWENPQAEKSYENGAETKTSTIDVDKKLVSFYTYAHEKKDDGWRYVEDGHEFSEWISESRFDLHYPFGRFILYYPEVSSID